MINFKNLKSNINTPDLIIQLQILETILYTLNQ